MKFLIGFLFVVAFLNNALAENESPKPLFVPYLLLTTQGQLKMEEGTITGQDVQPIEPSALLSIYFTGMSLPEYKANVLNIYSDFVIKVNDESKFQTVVINLLNKELYQSQDKQSEQWQTNVSLSALNAIFLLSSDNPIAPKDLLDLAGVSISELKVLGQGLISLKLKTEVSPGIYNLMSAESQEGFYTNFNIGATLGIGKYFQSTLSIKNLFAPNYQTPNGNFDIVMSTTDLELSYQLRKHPITLLLTGSTSNLFLPGTEVARMNIGYTIKAGARFYFDTKKKDK